MGLSSVVVFIAAVESFRVDCIQFQDPKSFSGVQVVRRRLLNNGDADVLFEVVVPLICEVLIKRKISLNVTGRSVTGQSGGHCSFCLSNVLVTFGAFCAF